MAKKLEWEDVLPRISYDGLTGYLKTISYRAIWNAAIAYDGKDIENRSGDSYNKLRGTFGMHASAMPPHRDIANIADYERISGKKLDFERAAALCGKLVGVVDIIDCFEKKDGKGSDSYWAEPGYNHLVLARPRLIYPFIPASGGTFLINYSQQDIIKAAKAIKRGEEPAQIRHHHLK
ncbi:MAG: hypothetical protein GC136_01400 [Alphaproteobacteria bacterium]|nr:hypothetical protein [Alphaproteobacteria bacterium]